MAEQVLTAKFKITIWGIREMVKGLVHMDSMHEVQVPFLALHGSLTIRGSNPLILH